ncbi:MAG: hypothetical protein ABI888_06370 [Chloroflexota bacterium]
MPVGKGWSKGLTKATDPRVARNATAHVGRSYQRHLPFEEDRRHRSLAGAVDTTWTANLAYAVGLIATDGNLSPTKKSITVVSGDIELLATFKVCIPRAGRIGRHGPNVWHVSVSSVTFYRWLESIGLTARKSLTIGAIDVPDAYFPDLARGLLDGDGSITNMVLNPGGAAKRYPDYRYERVNAVLRSASRAHVEWIRESMRRVLDVETALLIEPQRVPTSRMYTLRYGKHATLTILSRFYADPHRLASSGNATFGPAT